MSTGKKRPIHQYSEQALAAALEAVKNGMGVREASRLHSVPKTTILDRIHGRIKVNKRKMGPPTILSAEEEDQLADWLKELAKRGFPQKKNDLLNTVEKIITSDQRITKFKDNRPGQKWYINFLKRHPDLSLREPEGLSKARAVIKECQIREWFATLQKYLAEIEQEDILNDPRRILNGDETSFSMCPKTGRVLAPKGWRNVYEVKKSGEKETLTVLLVFSAAGETLYPMVVFPYVRPPASVVRSVPLEWFLGKSDTGWMRSETFFEYVTNGVNRWLTENNVPRPVILFVDGHKSHLSYQLSKFCDEQGIILYSLPPNTTHLMQPADVSVFKPLKSEWKKTVRVWQAMPENSNCTVNKSTFCPLLQKALSMPTLPQSIRNGFKRCGLFPFDPNAVDYTKCISKEIAENDGKEDEAFKNVSAEDIRVAIRVIKKYDKPLTTRGINLQSILEVLQQNDSSMPASEIWETFEVQENGTLVLPLNNETDEVINEDVDETTADKVMHSEDGIPTEKDLLQREDVLFSAEDLLTTGENVLCTEETGDSNDVVLLNISNISSGGTKGRSQNSFQDHLFWPEPVHTKRSTTSKERLPAAISSASYRQYLEEKENRKKAMEEAKQKRKCDRSLKLSEKKLKNSRKAQAVCNKENTRNESASRPVHTSIKCSSCEDELVSDVEDDDLKNVGCDRCERWYHLMCTTFLGSKYEEVKEQEFICPFC